MRPEGGRAVNVLIDLNHVLLKWSPFLDFATNKLLMHSIELGSTESNSWFGCLFFIRIHSVRADLVESFHEKSIFDFNTAINR